MAADLPSAFLSYAREDSEFALRLAEDLKRAGAAVWIDQRDIEAGQPWDRAVESALNTCPRMLVLLSPAAVSSDNVLNEIARGLRKQKIVIPVLYLECDIPLLLERHQHIDVRSDYASGLKTLLRALAAQTPRSDTSGSSSVDANAQASDVWMCQNFGLEPDSMLSAQSPQAGAMREREQPIKLYEVRTLTGHRDIVGGLAATADGRAVSASHDKTLKTWKLAGGREVLTFSGHTGWVYCVADGRRVISGSTDTTLELWELRTGKTLQTFRGHSESVEAVALMPDGERILSASFDRTVKLWELASGRQLRTFTGHHQGLTGIAVTPNGERILASCSDETVKVWDVASGTKLRSFKGHCGYVKAVAITPDGNLAVSASYDHTLKVWDLASGRDVRTLIGHTDYVNALALMPDGKRAVSASSDQTVRLWDLNSGNELASFKVDSGLYSCAVSPDGREVLAGDSRGIIHCLRVE